jgi:hypothetical protein
MWVNEWHGTYSGHTSPPSKVLFSRFAAETAPIEDSTIRGVHLIAEFRRRGFHSLEATIVQIELATEHRVVEDATRTNTDYPPHFSRWFVTRATMVIRPTTIFETYSTHDELDMMR